MAAVPQAINPFGAPAQAASNAVAASHQQREGAEVQGAIAVAQRFPRDPVAAMSRILNACTRPTLAEHAVYTYARGGQDISGPSIRLAEAIAQEWGNLQFGIREVEARNGESTVEAFAWDVERNVRRVVAFQVAHERHTKNGVKRLTDPRDVYELVANQGARRMRACILAVIPGDVVEAAVKQCETTLKARVEVTPELIASLLDKFKPFGIDRVAIQKRVQRDLEAITPAQVVQLGKIYNSLRDGIAQPGDFFEVGGPQQAAVAALNDTVRSQAAAAKKPAGKPPTYEQLSSSIMQASSLDALAEIRNIVPSVERDEDRDELLGMLQVREAELRGE